VVACTTRSSRTVKTNSAVLAAIHKLTGRRPNPRINRIRSRAAGFSQPPPPLPAPTVSETVQAAAAEAVEVEVEVVVARMPTEPQQLRGAAAKLAEARQRATLAVVKPIQRKAAARPVVQKARAHTAAAAAATPKEATAAALRKPPPPPPTSRLKGKENVNREAAAANTAPRRSRAPAGATAGLGGRGGRGGTDDSRGASGGGAVALVKRNGGSGDGRTPGDKRTWQSPVSRSASAVRGRGRGAVVAAAAAARPTTTAGRLAAKLAATAAARVQGGTRSVVVKKAVAAVEPRRTRQGATQTRRPQREKAGPRTEWAFRP
jgi:hypothetical protein